MARGLSSSQFPLGQGGTASMGSVVPSSLELKAKTKPRKRDIPTPLLKAATTCWSLAGRRVQHVHGHDEGP